MVKLTFAELPTFYIGDLSHIPNKSRKDRFVCPYGCGGGSSELFFKKTVSPSFAIHACISCNAIYKVDYTL